jgi:hypothetical protein
VPAATHVTSAREAASAVGGGASVAICRPRRTFHTPTRSSCAAKTSAEDDEEEEEDEDDEDDEDEDEAAAPAPPHRPRDTGETIRPCVPSST